MIRSVHALPRWLGIFLIIVGALFFIPLLAMIHIFSIPELWTLVVQLTGWSWLMIGWVLFDVMLVAILWAYGAEIIYYHDKHNESKQVKDYSDWENKKDESSSE